MNIHPYAQETDLQHILNKMSSLKMLISQSMVIFIFKALKVSMSYKSKHIMKQVVNLKA